MTLQGLEMLTGLFDGLNGLWNWLQMKASVIDDFGDFVFFHYVLERLEHDIREFGEGVIGRVMQLVQWAALSLLTVWVFVQGYRVLTGQMREPLMQLVVNSLRAVLIVTVALSFSALDEPISRYVTHDMKDGIHWVITGEEGSPEDEIDSNLGWMQVAMSSLDVLETGGDLDGAQEKERAVTMIGFGTGGPPVVAGALLLMYQVAMVLFIGLGPIFILCLLFNSTKSLFQRWLLYGIGTMFSMAVLSAMVTIALRMVTDVAVGMWASDAIATLLLNGETTGYSSRALQSGGMGLILTLLLITVPPMAANFFQGTLGGFMHYSAFAAGGAAAAAPSAYGPAGSPMYQPPQPTQNQARTDIGNQGAGGFHTAQTNMHSTGGVRGAPMQEPGIRQGSPLRDQAGPDPNAGRYYAGPGPSSQPPPPPKDRT